MRIIQLLAFIIACTVVLSILAAAGSPPQKQGQDTKASSVTTQQAGQEMQAKEATQTVGKPAGVPEVKEKRVTKSPVAKKYTSKKIRRGKQQIDEAKKAEEGKKAPEKK